MVRDTAAPPPVLTSAPEPPAPEPTSAPVVFESQPTTAPSASANVEPARVTPTPEPPTPVKPSVVVPADPYDQSRTLWRAAIDAEARRDFAGAAQLYIQIKQLPQDVWPAGLQLRLDLAQKRAGQTLAN
jgi:hypothetical protein